ncbi:YceI family protein, partial [Micromonospora sp. WMMD736]|uniref:YceI family protein n=1 Tax=Micromonospora sp. WMMD736 TaxID=3404112 RepID=UPI003B931B4F
ALKSLDAGRHPQVRFRTTDVTLTEDCYRLVGTLEIHGKSREHTVELGAEDIGDRWRMTCESEVVQTEFGVRPFSMFMGSMKVADTVTVSFSAERAKDA